MSTKLFGTNVLNYNSESQFFASKSTKYKKLAADCSSQNSMLTLIIFFPFKGIATED
jgi:hypothetical protein